MTQLDDSAWDEGFIQTPAPNWEIDELSVIASNDLPPPSRWAESTVWFTKCFLASTVSTLMTCELLKTFLVIQILLRS